MRYFLLICMVIFARSASAQFSSISTNLAGWATGNINVAVDLNINQHNTINVPISVNPFSFGETHWKHYVVQPGWRHWIVERYLGHFISPSLVYANYDVQYNRHSYIGNAYGIGFSWGYSVLLSTRWNFIVEIGAGVVYTPYTEQKLRKYIGEFDDEYIYHHRQFLFVPMKCNLSFSYLF